MWASNASPEVLAGMSVTSCRAQAVLKLLPRAAASSGPGNLLWAQPHGRLAGVPQRVTSCRAHAVFMPCGRGQRQAQGQAASSGPSPTAAWLASHSAAASRALRACADGCFSLHACQ